MDMNLGMIILTFDEDIEPSSANLTGIIIQPAMNVTLATLTIHTTPYVRLQSDQSPNAMIVNNTVTIQLNRTEVDNIKIRPQLATLASNTYLSMDPTAFTDRAFPPNAVQGISNEDALMVSIYIPDRTPPYLVFWTLDINAGIIELHFSETVNVTMFQYYQFAIQDSNSTSTATFFVTLTSCMSVILGPASRVVFQLGNDDLSIIKTASIGTSRSDSFLSVGESAVVDVDGNWMVPIPSTNAFQAAFFIPDSTRPELVSFSFDFGLAELIMKFSEIVSVTSFNVTGISLINEELEPTEMFTLTGGSTSSLDSAVIIVNLVQEDLGGIDAAGNLATSVNNTYIVALSSTISDTVGNEMVPIALPFPLQASSLYSNVGKIYCVYTEIL